MYYIPKFLIEPTPKVGEGNANTVPLKKEVIAFTYNCGTNSRNVIRLHGFLYMVCQKQTIRGVYPVLPNTGLFKSTKAIPVVS